MFTLKVNNTEGKQKGEINLDEIVFDGKVNQALMHQVKVMYQANKRQGTAASKTRAQVRGGNSKPWRQKVPDVLVSVQVVAPYGKKVGLCLDHTHVIILTNYLKK